MINAIHRNPNNTSLFYDVQLSNTLFTALRNSYQGEFFNFYILLNNHFLNCMVTPRMQSINIKSFSENGGIQIV